MKKLLLSMLCIPFCAAGMEQDVTKFSTRLAKLIALQNNIVNPGEFTTQSKVCGSLPNKDVWIKCTSQSTVTIEFWTSKKNEFQLTAQIPNGTLSLQREDVTQENLKTVIAQQIKTTVESITKDK